MMMMMILDMELIITNETKSLYFWWICFIYGREWCKRRSRVKKEVDVSSRASRNILKIEEKKSWKIRAWKYWEKSKIEWQEWYVYTDSALKFILGKFIIVRAKNKSTVTHHINFTIPYISDDFKESVCRIQIIIRITSSWPTRPC